METVGMSSMQPHIGASGRLYSNEVKVAIEAAKGELGAIKSTRAVPEFEVHCREQLIARTDVFFFGRTARDGRHVVALARKTHDRRPETNDDEHLPI